MGGDVKRFDDWIEVKKDLHHADSLRTAKEGEIWWCGMGENVGVEINGKGDRFARPVLILRKLSKFSFVGIPLTSQSHSGSWYVHFRFKNKDEYAILAQLRVFSVKRLYRKMGNADDADIAMILKGLKAFLFD